MVLLILRKVCFFVLALTFTILYNFLSSLLLLIKSVGYYLWAIMKKIINYVTIGCDFHLAGTLSCWHFVSPSHLFTLIYGKGCGQELKEASSQQLMRSWCLSPTTQEKVNPANSYVSDLASGSSQLSLEMTVACETQNQRIQLKFSTVLWCAWIPDLQEFWVCSKGCFLTFLTLTDLICDW